MGNRKSINDFTLLPDLYFLKTNRRRSISSAHLKLHPNLNLNVLFSKTRKKYKSYPIFQNLSIIIIYQCDKVGIIKIKD